MICKNCGREFKERSGRQRLCSTTCRDASMTRWKHLICEQCGIEFHRHPWEVRQGKNKFCGRACYHKSRIGKKTHPNFKPKENVCTVCGKKFLVGGRGRPRERQRICSWECQRLSRFKSGAKAEILSATDAAYMAGLIDGEGSVMLYMRRDVVAARLCISNTFRGVLDWTRDTTGVGQVLSHRKASDKHRANWQWVCNSEAAETVLRQVRPFLKIKGVQADLVIEVMERLRQPALKADRSWHRQYYERMRAMNKRGPRKDDA